MALNVDWSLAQSLFQEGVSLKNIAMRTGIPYFTLTKRANRHGWTQMVMPPKGTKTKAVQSGQMTVLAPQPQTPDRASNWTNRVGNMAERCMSKLEDKMSTMSNKDICLDTVEQIVRVTELTDRTARRTFGLDGDRNLSVTLQVQSELPAQRQLEDRSEVLEVETVPNLDTPPTDSAK